MIHNVKEIHGYRIDAKDDEMGKAEAFLFDDESWTIRYLAVDTHKWLPGRTVLISPGSIETFDYNQENVSVSLTKEQVRSSPEIDTKQPVSRQKEFELHQYYGLNPYWTGPGIWGPGPYPGSLLEADAMEKTRLDDENPEESHLRETSEVRTYKIHALDGEIGHVEDFLIDDQSWQIRYIVADTKNWLPGKKVLLSPHWFSEVSWLEGKVFVDLHKDTIKKAPEYDPLVPVSREFEEELHRVFRKPPYWGK